MEKTKGLTKQDSQCLKGIAIMMMLFHHLYLSESWFKGFEVSFYPFEQDFIVSISAMMKICVSIFAFISGYGLIKSISKTPLNKKAVELWSVNRLLKTMSGFYFIYIVSVIVTQLINKLPQQTYFDGSRAKGIIYMLTDFLGLSSLFSFPKLVGSWWYMSAAIIFVLLIPLIYTLGKRVGYLPVIIIAVAVPRFIGSGFPGSTNPFTFLLPLIFGAVFGDYNLFERISEILPKNKVLSYITAFIVFGAGVIGVYFVFVNIPVNEGWDIEYGIAPLFYICFFRYCIIRIPVIKTILAFFGKYSMTIFLTHSFVRHTYLHELVYSQGNFMKIFTVLFVLSLALAIVIDNLKRLIGYDKMFDKFTKGLTDKINKTSITKEI